MNSKMNIAIKIDLFLVIMWGAVFGAASFLKLAMNPWPFIVSGIATIAFVHITISKKVLKPLQKFIEIADTVADGDVNTGLEELRMSDLEEVQGSFTKIVGNLMESRIAIEDYMKKIGEINKELETKVDSLSILYNASQSMGGSLNVDTLTRALISTFSERLGIKGSLVMLYDDKNDLVSVKDLFGVSPELFAKFRFYSDNKILANLFNEDGYWQPSDKDISLMVAEFGTDAIRALQTFVPMRIKDHFVGLIALSQKNDNSPYSETDIQVIKALCGLASTSINNASLFEKSESTKNELDHKVFNLMTLQQSGKVLSSTLDLSELIKISIDMFLETVWANKGVLLLQSLDSPTLEVVAAKGIEEEEMIEISKDPMDSWAMTTIEKEKKAIFAHDLAGKASYQSYMVIKKPLPFEAYVPMLKEGDIYGVIKVGKKINGEAFTENDLEFFSTLSSQAVIAFENARLYSLAITDSITKLYVHRYFQLRLEEEVARSRRYNSTISLLMCDIDHFKNVNDTYGHQQGDIILKEISKILKKNVRSTDIAARYGGEEFAIVLPETTQADAKIVAERIRRDVHEFKFPSVTQGAPIRCSISIGVAGFPLNANDKDQLITKADNALYKAKDIGRNKVVLCGMD